MSTLSDPPKQPLALARAQGMLAALRSAIERHPTMLPLALYVLFAALVYIAQGREPPLSIDHVSYFKLADEILGQYPRGDYWRSFHSVRIYGVLLAYLHDLTGSHVISLKVLLAIMSVACLWAFQLFMRLATASVPRAVLFSLLSGLFVTFGASIWGLTDFSASLNRTLILPFVILLVWFFFRWFATPWRYAVFPALILLSLLHLSALHVFLVFGAFELFDYMLRRRFRLDRNILYFAVALICSALLQGVVEYASSATSYVRYTINMTVPSAAELTQKPQQPPATTLAEVSKSAAPEAFKEPPRPIRAEPPKVEPPKPPAAAKAVPPKAEAPKAEAPKAEAPKVEPPKAAPKPPEPPKKLASRDAWTIELIAFPWRNFPPSLATVATMLSSFGLILVIAVTGAVVAIRSAARTGLDREMVSFACGVVVAAYGLQVLLWVLRDMIPIFPINFEEIRAINLVMIPAIYFTYRLYELAPAGTALSANAFRVVLIAAFILQPIYIVRALPTQWREGMVTLALERGVLKSSDAPRMLYARQFLGLANDGRRFYYSSRPAEQWLERHAKPTDKVLTNLTEMHSSRLKAVGHFLGIVHLDPWDPARGQWARDVDTLDRAMRARDTSQILALAKKAGAAYAIVDWPAPEAVYRDEFFSILQVQ